MKAIGPKHRKFVEYYLSDPSRNATTAYLKIYPKSRPNVAAAAVSRLLKNVNVLNEIKRIENIALQKLEITEDRIIQQIVQDREDARKAKQYSVAMKANELLGRSMGMFEKMQASGITFEDILLQKLEMQKKADGKRF